MVRLTQDPPPTPPRPLSTEERRKQAAMNASVKTFRLWALEQQNQALHDAEDLTGEEKERCMQKVQLLFEAWKATVVFEREFGADRGN
ncbi:MAG: hypothetical protein PHQ58_22975 [Rhodoferax sp.]|uniref:hypothetical protein n=1 Tax=Rhodoferax sp. TaxID=50421 RepID=UPI00260E9FDD|nr:hypothetical protein [Rhodoferax sp.]MDD2883284.1 hypothetical protein [Rhodoferax sp.]